MSERPNEINIYSVGCYTFTNPEIEELMKGGRRLSLKRNETLYNAGEYEKSVYYLRQGRMKFHMLYPDGSSRISAYVEAPALLGIINVLPGQETINYCTSVTSCTLTACSSDQFLYRIQELGLTEKLMQYSIGMARHIYSCLNALLSQDRNTLVDVLRNKQHLTLQETADYIGCSRVHVSRICKYLEEQGRSSN